MASDYRGELPPPRPQGSGPVRMYRLAMEGDGWVWEVRRSGHEDPWVQLTGDSSGLVKTAILGPPSTPFPVPQPHLVCIISPLLLCWAAGPRPLGMGMKAQISRPKREMEGPVFVVCKGLRLEL